MFAPGMAAIADGLKPVRALKRQVQATVFIAILLSGLFYLFVRQRGLGEVLLGVTGSLAIAIGAIEGAFYQIFRLRKRAAYPVEIAVTVGTTGEMGAACSRAIEVVQRQFDVRVVFLALTGAGGPPVVQAAAGIAQEEAQALLESRAREAWLAMATEAPVQCGEPGPAVQGIDDGARLALVPIVAAHGTTGLMGLVGDRRNAGLRDTDLLRNAGFGLGLSLENVRQKQELREKESRLRTVITGAPIGLFAMDKDGVFTLSEGSIVESMGLTSGQLVGQSAFDLYKNRPDLTENYRRVLAGEAVTACTELAGQVFESMLAPAIGDDGEVTGIIGVAWDVTKRERTEAALRENEELLRSVVSNMPMVLFAVDEQGVFTLSEGKGLESLGLKPGEVVGQSIQDVYAGSPEILANIKRAMDGEAFTAVVEVAGFGWETSYAPVRGADGKVTGVIGVAADITERVRAEGALRVSENRLRALIENAADAIFSTGMDDRFTSVNAAVERMLGYTREELLGADVARVIAPEHKEMADRMTALKVEQGGRTTYEMELIAKDGRRVPVEISSWLVQDGDGPATVHGIARDITERRQAERALRESEERYRELFDNATDIVYTHDLTGQFLSINGAAARLTGYTAEEAMGMSIARVVAPEHLQMAAEMIRRKMTDGGQTTYELDIITKDGRRAPLEVSSRIIYEDGKPVAVQGTARDITERRRVEQALHRREAVLKAVSFAAGRFLVAAVDDADNIHEVLARLGEATGVNRVYIFENSCGPDRQVLTSQRYEWTAAGTMPQIDNPDLQDFPVREAGFGRWEEAMTRGQVVVGHVREFPEAERQVLEPQEVKSIAAVPIFVGGAWWGFIGFDECAAEREWPAVEMDALKTAADLVGAAIQRKRFEEALGESEEKYRELVENSNEVIYTLDAGGVVTYVSPVVEQVGGFKPEEIIGTSFLPLIHPEDVTSLVESFQRTIGGKLEPSEYRLKTKSGGYRWVRSSSRPVYENGTVVGLRGMLLDITDRRLAEDALRAVAKGTAATTGDEFFRSLVRHLAAAVGVRFALIGELVKGTSDKIDTLAVWSGQDFEDNVQYELAGTPCENVVGRDARHYPENVQALFPGDPLLAEMGIESYLGMPLFDSAGTALGVLAVMDGKRLETTPSLESIMAVFAARAGAELERKRAGEALRESEERYRNVFEAAQDVIYTLGMDGTLTSLNPAFETVTGWPCADWAGKSFAPLIHPDELNMSIDYFRRILAGETVHYELQILTKEGGYVVGEFASTPLIEDGRITGALGFARDITERKKAEKMIRQLAYHDALTGLPNRALFEDRLRVALAQAHRNEQMLAVMFLDLDRFKLVNDTLGHGDGDKLLQDVARDLSELIREGDTVARVGGDEFTLLLPGINQVGDATDVAERILERLKQPRLLGGHEFRVTTSIGVTIYPEDGMEPAALLRNADTAMYRAKERGRDNFQCYTPAMNANIMERLDLERDLRSALEREEFVVHYQPVVDVAMGRVMGAEALVRWQRPGLGLTLPDEFIPLMEETGMILPLGEWVMRTACRQNKAWQDAGHPPVRVAVNLSARQLQHEGLVGTVAGILAETGLAPEYLQLEITESAVMTNLDVIIEVLYELRAIGVGLSVDDFGTGYSSLSYLKRFPIDNVKIDRSFVRDLAVDPNDAAIVTTIIAMARSLNLKVIAEGVETEEQLAFLKSRACDEFQGFLFCKAVSADAFEKLLDGAAQPRAKAVRVKPV